MQFQLILSEELRVRVEFVLPSFTRFAMMYEAYNRKKFTHSITLQPPVADQAFMPHMKAMYVPFHMGYDSLITYQRL